MCDGQEFYHQYLVGLTPLLAFCRRRGTGARCSINRGRYRGDIGLCSYFGERRTSYRTARGGAAERGVVRTSRTRVGLRRGWLVAMICAVGDVLGADGGVALEGVAGAA